MDVKDGCEGHVEIVPSNLLLAQAVLGATRLPCCEPPPLFAWKNEAFTSMPTFDEQLQEKCRQGDISALLTFHEFCCAGQTKSHAVFARILEIVLINLRPELHPEFSTAFTVPRNARSWLKTITICISALVNSIEAKTPSFPPHEGSDKIVIESISNSVSLSSCRKMSQHWRTHFWPCIRAIVDRYLTDDLQPAISAHIHKETIHTAICSLIMYLQDPRVGLLARMRETAGMTERATRLFIQALDWYPHPSGYYSRALVLFVLTREPNAIHELETNPRFLPALLGFLRQQKIVSLSDREHEVPMIVSLSALGIKAGSNVLPKRAAAHYPVLLDELLRVLSINQQLQRSPDDSGFYMYRQQFLKEILDMASAIIKYGGCTAHRQAVKKRMLRHILKTSMEPGRMERTRDLILNVHDILEAFQSSLFRYSVLRPILHELEIIEVQALDLPFLSCRIADETVGSILDHWRSFCRSAKNRVSPVLEYKEFVLQQNPFCSYEGCPKDRKTSRTGRCSTCEYMYYCSRRCQQLDWPKHRKICTQAMDNKEKPGLRNALDADFLEYQLNYDIQHYKPPPSFRFDPTDADYLECNYNVLPPKLTPKKHVNGSKRRVPPPPRPDMMPVMILLPDSKIADGTYIPYGYAPTPILVAALSSGDVVCRAKGERFVIIHGVLNFDPLPGW